MASEPSSSRQKRKDVVYNSRVMGDFRRQILKTSLPTYRDRLRLLKAVHDNQVLIIAGQKGSGKTTQIPLYLHEAGFTKHGQIACTQPWGVIAKSAAIRVSDEMYSKIGDKVGYSIGFEDCTSTRTVIKYITDRMLLNEVLYEPNLDSYSVIMVDEANERTVATDLLLALVKNIVGLRKDLKLLISSATLVDAKKISEYFGWAPVFYIEVKNQYPVDISFAHAPVPNYIDIVIFTVLDIYFAHKGDILVFLTSQEEIEKVDKILQRTARDLGIEAEKLIICHAHANLRTELQAEIFEPIPYDGACKVVLATNIAETAFKASGIPYVVDPGFCEVKSYNPQTNMESVSVSRISKRSAMLRAESSECTLERKCFRLYTEYSFQHDFLDNTVPEIQRTNPANLVLMLKSLNINDLTKFDFMDPPCLEDLSKAHEQLYALNALNRQVAMRVSEELRREKLAKREKGRRK